MSMWSATISCARSSRPMRTRGRGARSRPGQMKFVASTSALLRALWRRDCLGRAPSRARTRSPRRRRGKRDASELAPTAAEVSLCLADDAALRELNGAGAESTSRPTCCRFLRRRGPPGRRDDCSATSRWLTRRSRARPRSSGVPLADHYRHLIVHGFLHLIGYDHETDAEARAHGGARGKILARLGVGRPLCARSRGG